MADLVHFIHTGQAHRPRRPRIVQVLGLVGGCWAGLLGARNGPACTSCSTPQQTGQMGPNCGRATSTPFSTPSAVLSRQCRPPHTDDALRCPCLSQRPDSDYLWWEEWVDPKTGVTVHRPTYMREQASPGRCNAHCCKVCLVVLRFECLLSRCTAFCSVFRCLPCLFVALKQPLHLALAAGRPTAAPAATAGG